MTWIGQTQALGAKPEPRPRRRRRRADTQQPLPQPPLVPGKDPDPTWGPIGSRLERVDPELYARIRDQDEARRAHRG